MFTVLTHDINHFNTVKNSVITLPVHFIYLFQLFISIILLFYELADCIENANL